jgi:hypothetical protein
MKFDAERALALAQQLDFPRHAGTEGERRAADLVAGQFVDAGLRIERRIIPGTSLPLSLIIVAFGGMAGMVVDRVFPGGPSAFRSGLTILGAASFVAALGLGIAISLQLGRVSYDRSELVVGIPPETASPPVRVVFWTQLATPDSGRTRLGYGIGLAAIGVPAAALIAARLAGAGDWFLWAGPVLFGGLWLGVVLFFGGVWERREGPLPGDNRTGLAVVAELARTWPKGARGRIEARFAVAGDGPGGTASLARWELPQWPPKPTLIIELDAPGLGTEFRLVGRGLALDLARGAARDLWLPHRAAGWLWSRRVPRAFERLGGIRYVGLAGDRRATRIDPALLIAAAQLATEIALRWDRRQRGTDQGESRARSSQNPG